jgi:diguanylate cyclase (GGDEF)-like protein
VKRNASASLSRLAAHRLGGPLLAFVGALAGFVALGRCGYQLVGASGGVASFWPATGLIVGLLVMAPSRLRPWILAALLPGEFITDVLMQGYPALTALGWGGTGTVEAALAAWIVLKLARGRPRGNRVRDFVALAVAAVAAPLVGGLGGGAVSVATFGGSFGTAWLNWLCGDAAGIMLVVPLVVSFASRGPRRSTTRTLVGAVEVGLVIGVAVAVFALTTQPLEFLILPPVVLLAVRHDLRLTALASLAFAIVATIFTGNDLGPLSNFPDIESRVIGLQTFIAATAFVAFLICAAMSERTRAEAALAELATQDPLTGLANRRGFMERLDEAVARRDRSSESAAVAYFDLDGFKQINDRLGHAAGDAVLVEVARRLSVVVRGSDLVARIGGDEFAALLEPVDDINGADAWARRMTDAVEQPFAIGDHFVSVGVSVGTALAGSDSDASLAEADTRLYATRGAAARRAAVSAA